MPVRPRGSGFEATVHYKGDRFRRQFSTRVEAEAWESQALADLRSGNLPDMGTNNGIGDAPASLEALRRLCHDRYWKGAKAEKAATINATKVIDTLGNTQPQRVTTAAVDAAVKTWKDGGASNGTINRRLSALSRMMTFAAERGYITNPPRIERVKEHKGRVRYYTEAEEAEMLAWTKHVDAEWFHDLIVVALDTGLRRGELLRLEARDLSDAGVTVWVSKGDKPRTVPLTKRARAVLDSLAAKYPSGRLFPHTEDSVRVKWDQLRAHMGADDDRQFVFHALRHTFVSRLVQRGVDIRTASELAGHATIQTTMIYAHLSPRTLAQAITVLEN